jgi:hypothetical protein
MPSHLVVLYNISESLINRVLRYNQIKRVRLNRISRPYLFNDSQVNWIIEYLSESYKQKTLN